jgi:hypothetical protein
MVRAKRSVLCQKGDVVSFEVVLKNVVERDYIDTHRADSPLAKANNAIEIDNSHLSREEHFEKAPSQFPLAGWQRSQPGTDQRAFWRSRPPWVHEFVYYRRDVDPCFFLLRPAAAARSGVQIELCSVAKPDSG